VAPFFFILGAGFSFFALGAGFVFFSGGAASPPPPSSSTFVLFLALPFFSSFWVAASATSSPSPSSSSSSSAFRFRFGCRPVAAAGSSLVVFVAFFFGLLFFGVLFFGVGAGWDWASASSRYRLATTYLACQFSLYSLSFLAHLF
jgi:hypothetical protein